MSFAPHDYLRHILDECDFLLDTAGGISEEEFLADKTLRRAFQRSLEIIGEASKQLSGDFRSRFVCESTASNHVGTELRRCPSPGLSLHISPL
jgi:uncharacterized protein YutE (UPF0331/DUF86 family)